MTISTTSITKSGLGNGTAHSFVYDFPIFADADLTVIVRSAAGTETTKTLNTHYVVTGAGASSGGTVLFKFNTGTSSDAHYSATDHRPAAGETVVIRSELSNTQTLDLVANDPFPASSFEVALDRLVRMVQQHDEELDRSIKLSRTNTMTSTEFTTSATDRASKILAFDSSGEISVAQELGTFKGNSATTTTAAFVQRDIVKATTTAQLNNIYICVADSAIGDALTDTDHWALLVDAVSAATSATAAASSATAAASSASTASTQASNAATSLATFQGQYHGAASSDPSSNLDAGDLYFNTSSGMKVYTGSAWEDVKPTSSEQTNINTVAGSNSEIAALAASAVIADMALLGTSDVVADMALLATSDVISDMNTLATSDIISDLNTLATSDIVTDLNILATSANVTNMATLGASGVVSNIATVAGANSNLSTVATSISSVNNFATQYQVSANAPSNPTEGLLWFDQTNDIMKVYDGSGFVNAGSSVNGTANRFAWTVGTSSGSYNGSLTEFPATYDAGFVDVYLNGVKLLVGTDVTATNGSSVTLASAAVAADIVEITAYGTFTAATELSLLDNKKIQLGSSQDLQLFHDGTDSHINVTGALTVDVSGDINLDAGGGEIFFQDDGTSVAYFSNSSTNLLIGVANQDKDLFIQGNDGGSTINALQLDMSAAGYATFNAGGSFATELLVAGASASASTETTIENTNASGHGAALRLKQANTNANSKMVFDDAGTESGFVFDGGANSVVHHVNGAEKMRLTSDGLTFNGDTAAANALDDYEEGTWNASFAGSSSVQGGFYTKIGRSVTVFVYGGVNVTSVTTGRITNLPFVNNGGYVAATVTHDTYTNNSYNAYVGSGTTEITPIQDGTISGAQTVIGNPKYIMVSATYLTNS